MGFLLPRSKPTTQISYGALLYSLVQLWREEPRLRRATLTQSLLFASFSIFWTVLALRLEQPSFHLGADIAGMFGLVGLIGVLAAPVAGRMADHTGADPVVGAGALATLLAWLIMACWNSIFGMVVGVVLLDFGVQTTLIAHQQVIYGLRPQARNRINTLFVAGMFIGGSLGSGGAIVAWNVAAWSGVSGFGIALTLAASLGRLLHRERT
jgi:predicted MFS family arabinose efflux permease